MAEKVVELEFYHDVLCAWCFALAPRIRRLTDEYPKVRVVHRAFALAPTPEAIAAMFGSKEEGKREILNHWRAANRNDDEHRINAELMATRPFDYPYSMPGLLACKAAERQGGQEAHGAMFDRVQRAHFTECLNIADLDVLRQCAQDVGLDVVRWAQDYSSPATWEDVKQDLIRASQYGISGVPTLVADQRYRLNGAQSYERVKAWLNSVIERRSSLTFAP
ncbi:MAG: DsbA family protein [Limnochordaceae bacterium]|nr:DsbA family protein [Limnochordaceae bacterium]